MANEPEFKEPLNNVALESAMMGVRMSLTEEEEEEARAEFLTILKGSQLAIPTGNPVKVGPDGQLLPGADIQLIVAEHQDGTQCIRTFTSLTILRAALPELQHGLVLFAWQVAGMVASSPHALIVEGPDVHTIVYQDELNAIVAEVQEQQQKQQQAVEHNEALEAALLKLTEQDNEESRQEIERAFVTGFCRIPVLTEADGQQPHLVLTTGTGPDGGQQSIPLRTHDGGLLCFTSEETLAKWDEAERPMMVLPGGAIVEVSSKSGLTKICVNEGSPNARVFGLAEGRLLID